MTDYTIKLDSELGFRGELQTNVLVHAGPATVRAVALAPTITVTHESGSPVPGLDVGLTKNQWDLTTFGIPFSVGLAIGHLPGAFVGGFVGFAWGRWRWNQVSK